MSVSFCFYPASFVLLPPSFVLLTLSLHDALPIWRVLEFPVLRAAAGLRQIAHRLKGYPQVHNGNKEAAHRDRKSTRLNSSHRCISYAVFCLKKKKKKKKLDTMNTEIVKYLNYGSK